MNYTKEMIYDFLMQVDCDFPVAISSKVDLEVYAAKLFNYSTICAYINEGKIEGMVAGYSNDHKEGIGYIALVATLKSVRNQGIASRLVHEFIDVSKAQKMNLVHLYTDKSNSGAISMYHRLGFVEYIVESEPRPDDVHLVYYIERK